MSKSKAFFTNNIELNICTLSAAVIIYFSGCSSLPPVSKVNSRNINKTGVMLMLPKAEVYVSFIKYRTDSTAGLVFGYSNLIRKIDSIYNWKFNRKIVKDSRSTCRYSNFQVVVNYVQDTANLYSVNIGKKQKSFFSSLDFSLALSDEGVIQATEMASENQSAAVFSAIVGFGLNSIVPFVAGEHGTRGVSEGTRLKLATKLVDSLITIKKWKNYLIFHPDSSSLDVSNYIMDNLKTSETEVLDLLAGTYNTVFADSIVAPLNIGKDPVYVTENNLKKTYSVGADSGDEQNKYLVRIEPVWVSTFTNTSKSENVTGMPYKMPERVRLNIFNPYNQLISSINAIFPSKSTFYLPKKLGAMKSHLNIVYNPDGTINNITSNYKSLSPDETQDILKNLQPPSPH